MKNLSERELYKYEWRVQAFLAKYSREEPFVLRSGGSVKLIYDCTVVHRVTHRHSLVGAILKSVERSYRFSDLSKTEEFGGKDSFRRENEIFQSILSQIEAEKSRMNVLYIPIKMLDTIHYIGGVKRVTAHAKADFALIDRDGKDAIWISHKHGFSPLHFQQWCGISERRSPSIFKHLETQNFISSVKQSRTSFDPGTSFSRPIQDENLQKVSMYGTSYGESFSENNVHGIALGDVTITNCSDFYSITGIFAYNGDSVKGTQYEPAFQANYRTDRNNCGIMNCRMSISPSESRSNSITI
jgi:hypothetical protein